MAGWFLRKREKDGLSEVLSRLCSPELEEEKKAVAWFELRTEHSSISVSKIVDSLAPWLESNDTKVLECAIRVLVRIIEERDLDTEEISSMAEFCAKMSEIPACTPYTLSALAVLLSRHESHVFEIAKNLLLKQPGGLHVPAFGHRARQKAWLILDYLATHCSIDTTTLANGVASALEGEKDPRCLLRGLQCAEHALLNNGNEDIIYHCVSPYFPIAFSPPPNDPFRVTPERLRRALRRCLTATAGISRLGLDMAIVLLLGEDEPTTEEHEANEALNLIAAVFRWPLLFHDRHQATKALTAALSSTTRRCASEHAIVHCVESIFFFCYENTAALYTGPMADLLADVRPETVDGRFAVAMGLAMARGAGYCGWRFVFEALGNSVIRRVLLETEQNAVSAALETLVQLIDIPTPALSFTTTSEAPLLQHRDILLKALAVHDTDNESAASLRLKGFAALARRGQALDETQVIDRLIHEFEANAYPGCADLVKARPKAALQVLHRVHHLSDNAILRLASADQVLISTRFSDLLGNQPSIQVLRGLEPYATKMAPLIKRWLGHAPSDDDEYATALAVLVHTLLEADTTMGTSHEIAVMATHIYTQNTKSRPALRVLEVQARDASLSVDLLMSIGNVGDEPTLDQAGLTVLVAALLSQKNQRDAVLASSTPLSPRWLCAARAALASGEFLPLALEPLIAADTRTLRDAQRAAHAIATIVGLPALPSETCFWRQRLYLYLGPLLRTEAANGSEPAANALLALARAAPGTTLIADAASFVDVALNLHPKLAAPIFRLLLDAADQSVHEILRPRLEAVINKLVDTFSSSSSQEQSYNPRPKLDALRSVAMLSTLLPHSSLFPFRRKLATALRLPLDDPSREVRRLAAIVRNDWLAHFGGSIV